MQDRPTLNELLQAVTHFLDEEVVPNLDGSRQFYCRVAANMLRTAMRELEHEDDDLAAEWKRLNSLLSPEERPTTRAGVQQALRRRTGELCERIQRGEADAGPYRSLVLAHLRESVREKLVVSNPQWVNRPTT